MSHGIDESNAAAPADLAHRPEGSVREGVLFWAFYGFASLIIHMHGGNTGGIHQAILGNTPGPTSMSRYAMGWPIMTVVVIVIHVRWLHSIRYGWIIGVIAGLLSFIPGMLLCLVGIPR